MNSSSLNGTGADEAVLHKYSDVMLGTAVACAFILGLLGTIGNVFTIIALTMCKKLRTPTTAFVVNLAMTELLHCTMILLPKGANFASHLFYSKPLFVDKYCIFHNVEKCTFTSVEMQTIVVIALKRAIAVGWPKFYLKIDNGPATGIYILGIWIFSILLVLPSAFGISGADMFYNRQTLECGWKNENSLRLIVLLCICLIPSIVIFTLYIFIMITVKRSSRKVANLCLNPTSRPRESVSEESSDESCCISKKFFSNCCKRVKRMKSDISSSAPAGTTSLSISLGRRDAKVARSIFAIFLILLHFTAPVYVIHVIDPEANRPNTFLVIHIVYWAQFCLNIVVYVLMNSHYRKAYVNLLAKMLLRTPFRPLTALNIPTKPVVKNLSTEVEPMKNPNVHKPLSSESVLEPVDTSKSERISTSGQDRVWVVPCSSRSNQEADQDSPPNLLNHYDNQAFERNHKSLR